MIVDPTVLVLGAGASKPYGYPIGVELYDRVLSTLMNPYAVKLLNKLGFSEDKLHKFRSTFRKSGTLSVDEFLEARKKFTKLGKLLIAMEIIGAEKEDLLFDKKDWYHLLFSRLTAGTSFEQFKDNKLTIITFNYDRSLEHFIFEALKERYGKKVLECAEQAEKIKIIHVHGSVGLLPWQNPGGRKYSTRITEKILTNSANSIKIIHEDIDEDKEFEEAQLALGKAKNIYFIGFGYNQTNLERLEIKPYIHTKEIKGTIQGIRGQQMEFINNFFENKILTFRNEALDFLSDYGFLK